MINSLQVKTYLKSKFPQLAFLKQSMRAFMYNCRVLLYELKQVSPQSVFSEKFLNNSWAGQESVSGHGSDFVPTQTIREDLPYLIDELNIRSLIDAPCGDFYWMNLTNLQLEKYIGIDIVSDLIAQNQKKYRQNNREFLNLDITRDELPTADMILCRDCLVHLSFKDAILAIRKFKHSQSTYLLTTTYPGLLKNNKNIITGDWRPLDLEKPPFNFPRPMKLINENCSTVTDFKEKNLGLWKLEDIHI